MRLSIYTFIRDGIFYDYHAIDMLKHHLPLADEIVVNEGYSSDGTYEKISTIDPKIKIFRTQWDGNKCFNWFVSFKDEARKRCTGDWCILLDCDEFIPEWEFEELRAYLEETKELTVPVELINFYGNYKVYNVHPQNVGWPHRKRIIHRNLPDMEVWGDGSNVRLKNTDEDTAPAAKEFTCHHFGFVRKAARLRQKWRNTQSIYPGRKRWFSVPGFVFDLLPHDWKDPQFLDDLALYEGPFIKAVRENPNEFVRDGFQLYRYLVEQKAVAEVVSPRSPQPLAKR
jgi:glycosyltransferase involved in cell wall biosynthesis